MPAVKFSARLDLDQIGHFWMGTNYKVAWLTTVVNNAEICPRLLGTSIS
jgi:hypothetical protein